jgi:hypothetical protein
MNNPMRRDRPNEANSSNFERNEPLPQIQVPYQANIPLDQDRFTLNRNKYMNNSSGGAINPTANINSRPAPTIQQPPVANRSAGNNYSIVPPTQANNYMNKSAANSRPISTHQPGLGTLNNNNSNSKTQLNPHAPIYVPPFLLNDLTRTSRHRHNYNAPQDYLPWSIANIFICVIIAVPALFFSVQTRDMKKVGNLKKAKSNSKKSLILNIIASVVGLLTIMTIILLRFALYQLIVQNDVKSQNVPIIAGG